MHSPFPLWLSLLLSDLEPSRRIPPAQALETLVSHGSSGERCLARVALDLWNQAGLLSEIVWALDDLPGAKVCQNPVCKQLPSSYLHPAEFLHVGLLTSM